MSAACTLFGNCVCATCQARNPATPLSQYNRPRLDSIGYRVGTFSSFRQAMLDFITQNPVANPDPSGAAQTYRLTSRSSDDYAVAMLELWAYVCDVLTFYQQAIANEAYLLTATQTASLARIAALLGYRPAPAVAASVMLAFLANKNASAAVPGAFQAQSVPQPGQKPVIFETAGALAATAADNQPQLLGPKTGLTLSTSGILIVDDPNRPVAKGDTLTFYNVAQSLFEQRKVTAVTPQAWGKQVEWIGSLNSLAPGNLHTYRAGRTFRIFGANAPQSYPVLQVSGSGSSTTVSWAVVSSNFNLSTSAGSTISLDSVYSGLTPGSMVLVQYLDDSNRQQFIAAPLKSVTTGSASVGPMNGSVTGISFDGVQDLTSRDLRYVTIYELIGTPLSFSAVGFDQTSSGKYAAGAQSINILDASSILEGTEVLLASSDPVTGVFGEVVTVNGAPKAIKSAGVTLAYEVPFTPALANGYAASNTILYANVVAATEGKTQRPEILGSGDASQAWQQFALQAKPLTYVASPATGPEGHPGVATTLKVFVDSVEWTEVPTFYGHGPTETIFVTRTGDDGTVYVRFGDGVTGKRLTTGNKNVTAMYRAGAGSDGNVAAGAIAQVVQSVAGLKSVVNPLPAFGGEDAESPDGIRQNAPVSILTLNRVVSLRDYESLALTYPGIAKARASWTEVNDRRGVALTAAAAGDLPLGQLTQPLRDFLDQHRDPNVPLNILSVTPVPFVFRARIHVLDGYLQSAVKANVEAALGVDGTSGFLSGAQLEIGNSIFESELLSVLQKATGVAWVELLKLSGTTYMPEFNCIFIDPTEIAWPSLTGHAGDTSVDLSYTGGVNDLQ